MPSEWSLPPTLSPPFSGREAVADALNRSLLGLDTNDSDLFDSAFTQDATFEINGRVMDGLKAIHADCFDPISKLDTTHFITNTRVSIAEGGSRASLSASTLAQHYRAGTGMGGSAAHLMTGSLYMAELVRDDAADGLWRIKTFRMKSTWVDGDWGVVTGN